MKPVSARLPVRAISSVEPDALLDLGALRGGALVVPEDRRPQHAVRRVERHQPVHLARQADPGGLAGRAQLLQHRLRGVPPQLGVLLGPARPRGGERVLALGAREHRAVVGERDPLDGGGAYVEPDRRHAPSAAYTSS